MKNTYENRRRCAGCHDDFYNGNNALGVERCWNFTDARVILRKRVGVTQRPPWEQKAEKYPSCYHQDGYVFVKPHQTY